MKIDLYSKFVLTVIAICLSFIAFQNVPNAKASRDIIQKVDVVAIGGKSIWSSVPVTVITK